jgi:hypothetical protein
VTTSVPRCDHIWLSWREALACLSQLAAARVEIRGIDPKCGIDWTRGTVLHCFEDEMSWGFFLAEPGSLTSPEVDIVLGGQVQERWPRQLFVDPSLGAEALDYFLETGKQKETLHWIRTDAVPRETAWEGRAGREAWEKGQP